MTSCLLSSFRSFYTASAKTTQLNNVDLHYSQQLAEQTARITDSWIEHIRMLLAKADSLEAFKEDVLNAYGDLDTGELTKIMAMAFACAELAGRFDVQSEAGLL